MNDFLLQNHYLSNIFLKSYQEEKKQFDDFYIELNKNARDTEYAKVVSSLPIFLISLLRKSNKLDEKILELYKSGYRLGWDIDYIIPQIRNVVKVFKDSKSAPNGSKVRFKGWKIHFEPEIESISMFETCDSDEEIAKELGRLIAFYDIQNEYEAALKKLINNETTKPFKVEPIMEIENYKNYQTLLNPNSTDEEIIWIYLKALYDLQESIGIYYILPKELIDDRRINRIVKRIQEYQLAINESVEFGNNNIYMKISQKGDDAIERFQTFREYQTHLNELENKRNSNSTSIINNGSNSTIQVGNNNSSIIISKDTLDISKKIVELIDFLLNNSEIEINNKREVIKTLEKTNDEVNEGKITSSTWMKFLGLGDQISSIGSFISTIVQMIKTNGGLL